MFYGTVSSWPNCNLISPRNGKLEGVVLSLVSRETSIKTKAHLLSGVYASIHVM